MKSHEYQVRTNPSLFSSLPKHSLLERKVIGQGGMSTVFLSIDEFLLRPQAVKTLRSEHLKNKNLQQKFITEAQIISQLDHPCIVPIYSIGITKNNIPFYSMKVIRGKTLDDLIYEKTHPPESFERLSQLIQIVIRVCDAVSYAHEHGVLHLDLKPENILVGDFGEVYVVDWGTAWLMNQENPDKMGVYGTPAYMPKEQAEGRFSLFDERTDLFGIAAIVYEIITLQPPYCSETEPDDLLAAPRAVDISRPESICTYPVPQILSNTVMKSLSAEQNQRHSSVRDFQRELAAFLDSPWKFPKRTFKAGDHIIMENAPDHGAYIIIEGNCTVTKRINGQVVEIRRLGKDDLFGELSFLSGVPRTATVTALDQVTVLVLDYEYFSSGIATDYWLNLLMNTMVERFKSVEARELTAQSIYRDKEFECLALRFLLQYGHQMGSQRVASWSDFLQFAVIATSCTEPDVRAGLKSARNLQIDENLNIFSCIGR